MQHKDQMVDERAKQGLSRLQPNDYIFLGHLVNHASQSNTPVLPASGNSADFHLQSPDPYIRNYVHGNHYNGMQYCERVSNNVGKVAPANFYNPYMPSSSSRLLSIPLNNRSVDHASSFTNQRAFGAITNDGRDNNIIDSLNEPGKRNNAGVVAENFYSYNAPENTNFSSAHFSLNFEWPQWKEPYNYGVSSVTPLTTAEGANRLVKNRSDAISLQPASLFSCHYNHVLQGNRLDQSFQPSSKVLVEQFGNYAGDWRCSNWNYADAKTYMHGTYLNPGHLEVANAGIHKYQGNPSNRHATFFLFDMHGPSFPNTYQNYSPVQNQNYSSVQNLQVHSYSHPTQIPTPSYWHPFINLHTSNSYALRDNQESCLRFVGPMPFISEQMYEAVPGISYDIRNPLFEDAAKLMEIPQFYGFEDAVDQYSDMRMDIDGMPYEELLDLEEKIGDVKTGLSEEFISKNLRTSTHVQQPTSSSVGSLSQSASENGTCTVCQVVYEENETVGTLDCGHNYHADCIKQWLSVKNICPICKAPALAADKREG